MCSCLLMGSDAQSSSLICPLLSPGRYLLVISANSARAESSEEPVLCMYFIDCLPEAISSKAAMPSSSTSIVPSAISTSISTGSDSADGKDSVITLEVSAIFLFLPHFFPVVVSSNGAEFSLFLTSSALIASSICRNSAAFHTSLASSSLVSLALLCM